MTCLNHASLAASLAALTVAADAAAASKPKSPAGKRPDVIVIMTDQQTAGAMSCAGNPWVRTLRWMRWPPTACALRAPTAPIR